MLCRGLWGRAAVAGWGGGVGRWCRGEGGVGGSWGGGVGVGGWGFGGGWLWRGVGCGWGEFGYISQLPRSDDLAFLSQCQHSQSGLTFQ